jgi:tetratricopeptide (TPR) repeat protein
MANEAGDHEAARAYAERSVTECRAVGDRSRLALALYDLGVASWLCEPENLDESRPPLEEALTIFEEQSDTIRIADVLHHLGEAQRDAGNAREAVALLEEAVSRAPEGRRAASIICGLGDVALDENDLAQAEHFYRDGLAKLMHEPQERDVAYCLAGLSAVAAARGQRVRVGRLWGAVEGIEERRQARLHAATRARYERRLERLDSIAMDDIEAGRAMPLDDAVAYALEEGE